jgi:hypothetical protein
MVKNYFIMFCLVSLFVAAPIAAIAARDTCARAARFAAEQAGVPADILLAITLVETRHDGTAWPWTLNHDGRGHWFTTAAEAERAAADILSSGGMADIGCFQINSRWHGSAFASVTQMLDPVENALYAARYLRRLHGETGDWHAAIAAYHSRDPARGQAYLDRVFGQMVPMPDSTEPPARRNRFPLLHAGDPGSTGTIVPRLAGLPPLIGGP